jgi:predicted nucleic acid-binding protein
VIVVDTSVWIAAQRKPAGRDAATLFSLLDSDDVLLPLPVRIELLSGVARKDRKAFTRALSALPVIVPTEETWRLAESWVAPAADAGHRFAVTDLVIGALATETRALVWSLDTDFERMGEIGLVRLYG